MNRCSLVLLYLLFNLISSIETYCSNDEDLQNHRCTCSLTHSYIQCSSFPLTCRTCYRYNTIFFDENVQNLPIEAFRFYNFFNSNKTFTIQFAQLNELSSNTFSKIRLEPESRLSIKIGRYISSRIRTRSFDDLSLQTKSIFDFEILQSISDRLIFEQYSFDGIQHAFQSLFKFSILNSKNTLEFESNTGSLLLPSFCRMEFYFSNFEHVLINEHSFDHITQEHASQFRLHFDHFYSATLEHTSFFDLHQLDRSKFYLTFSNFHQLDIEQVLFHSITQLTSDIVISIYNITSDLCFPAETFSQIQQDLNSTFQLDVNYGQNLVFNSYSFLNITQRAESKFSTVINNCEDIFFSSESLKNFQQEDQSLIDIWIKSSSNLLFDNNAIEYINIHGSSIMRIGYQYCRGKFQMSTNSFHHINEQQGGHLLFQIINSTDFSLRFNRTIQLERLEILDRILYNEDLCRIVNIPSHIPVTLLRENLCSCSVFYLYRQLRHQLNPLTLKDLTPTCYSRLSLDQIEYEEQKCDFRKQTRLCQQMEGDVHLEIPRSICEKTFITKSNVKFHSNSSFFSWKFSLIFFLFIVIGGYVLFKPKRQIFHSNICWKLPFVSRRQKLPIYTADSYQQLTHINENQPDDDCQIDFDQHKMMKIVVKYNSTTEQTQPYIQTDQSDFLVSNDQQENIFKLNTNPLSDIDDKQ